MILLNLHAILLEIEAPGRKNDDIPPIHIHPSIHPSVPNDFKPFDTPRLFERRGDQMPRTSPHFEILGPNHLKMCGGGRYEIERKGSVFQSK